MRTTGLDAGSGVNGAERLHGSGEIGHQLRHLRLARHVTLKTLAAATDLSIGYLSQLERGQSQLTVATLVRLSNALGVPASFFFSAAPIDREDERAIVVRSSGRRQLTFPGVGIRDELLSPDLAGPIEMLLCTIDPGADSGEPYQHEGSEAGFLMAGSLDLWVGERHLELEEGDSFSFASTTPHCYRNRGPIAAKVVWIITPPSY